MESMFLLLLVAAWMLLMGCNETQGMGNPARLVKFIIELYRSIKWNYTLAFVVIIVGATLSKLGLCLGLECHS